MTLPWRRKRKIVRSLGATTSPGGGLGPAGAMGVNPCRPGYGYVSIHTMTGVPS
jgi:hypothetical protein